MKSSSIYIEWEKDNERETEKIEWTWKNEQERKFVWSAFVAVVFLHCLLQMETDFKP